MTHGGRKPPDAFARFCWERLARASREWFRRGTSSAAADLQKAARVCRETPPPFAPDDPDAARLAEFLDLAGHWVDLAYPAKMAAWPRLEARLGLLDTLAAPPPLQPSPPPTGETFTRPHRSPSRSTPWWVRP